MKIVLIIIGLIVVALVVGYAYYGGFAAIKFKKEVEGGQVFVYKEVTGPYKQTGQVSDEVYYALLNDFKIETTKGAGVFHDDPKQVEESKLRSEIGCLLDAEIDSTQMAAIGQKYKIKTIPRKEYLVTEFPMKGMMSIMVAVMRVYPAIHEYCKENNLTVNGPMFEIYDVPSAKTVYLISVDR